MARFTRISAGVLRSFEESLTPAIYDEYLLVVASSPGANEVVGPITAGIPVTLPASGTYTGEELMIDLNGQTLENGFDFNFEGTPPRTQVSFTFELVVGDRIYFRRHRSA